MIYTNQGWSDSDSRAGNNIHNRVLVSKKFLMIGCAKAAS